MRVVLHAGLHKSGTTTIQHQWRQAYGAGVNDWYPVEEGARHPGHHAFIWPLLVAFSEARDNDLIWSANRARRHTSIGQLLSGAQQRGVKTVLLSTEELDRVEPDDVDRLRDLFMGYDVSVILTVTRPIHRWCSGWQEHVKHGLHQYPRDAAGEIMALSSTTQGRLQQLTQLIPGERHIIRVVRTRPPEDDLAQAVAGLAGLTWPDGVEPDRTRNTSMGVDIEVLRRINRLDLSLGTVDGRGRRVLAKLKSGNAQYADKPELAAAYEPPPAFWAAVRAEYEFLSDPGSSVEVVDPYGELQHWLSSDTPEWYEEVRTRELVAPQLDSPLDVDTMLWRVRQERSALRESLAKALQRTKELERVARKTERRHRKELKALRAEYARTTRRPLRRRVRKALRRLRG